MLAEGLVGQFSGDLYARCGSSLFGLELPFDLLLAQLHVPFHGGIDKLGEQVALTAVHAAFLPGLDVHGDVWFCENGHRRRAARIVDRWAPPCK